MKTLTLNFIFAIFLIGCTGQKPGPAEVQDQNKNTQEETTETPKKAEIKPMENIIIKTNKGEIGLELDPNKAPITVANFISYVDKGHYSGTVFHRVISNFMIQGGGFEPNGKQKSVNDPIVLESQNGMKNDIGTIAMARTNAPNSATAQFFINVTQNDFLNYAPGNPGYAVFGKVTSGMEVVNAIKQEATGVKNGMQDWPNEDVIIEEIRRVE